MARESEGELLWLAAGQYYPETPDGWAKAPLLPAPVVLSSPFPVLAHVFRPSGHLRTVALNDSPWFLPTVLPEE